MSGHTFEYDRIVYELGVDEEKFGDKNRLCVHLLNQGMKFKVVINNPIAPEEIIPAGKLYFWLVEVQNDNRNPTFPLILFLQAAGMYLMEQYQIVRYSTEPTGTQEQVEAWFAEEFGEQFTGIEVRIRKTGNIDVPPTPYISNAPAARLTPAVVKAADHEPCIRLIDFPGLRMADGTLLQVFVKAGTHADEDLVRVSGIPDVATGMITPALVESQALSEDIPPKGSYGWVYGRGLHVRFEPQLWQWAANWDTNRMSQK